MSQYSETIGSFIRTGNYPLEANYVFNSEQELKTFYSEDINNTLLHKGLFKIVSSEDQQTLYWVVLTDGQLLFKPLISVNSLEELSNKISSLRNDLDLEVESRETDILEIIGTPNKEDIQSELNNLLKISTAILSLKELARDNLSIIKLIIGTTSDNVEEYLQSLDYNSLTLISEKLSQFFNENSTLKDILDSIAKNYSKCINRDNNLLEELNLTQIGVGLDSSGMFSPDQETNYLKNATSVMNALKTLDSLIANGKEALIERAYYDSATEKIIIVFKTTDTDSLVVEIPAADLILEWSVSNNPNSVITLSKERVIDGPDVLSADIKIDSNSDNLLTKTNGNLLVDGSNIATKTEVNTLSTELSSRMNTIESIGGEPNVINTIKVNNVAQSVADKTVNLTIPTNVTDLEDSANYLTQDSLNWYEG